MTVVNIENYDGRNTYSDNCARARKIGFFSNLLEGIDEKK